MSVVAHNHFMLSYRKQSFQQSFEAEITPKPGGPDDDKPEEH